MSSKVTFPYKAVNSHTKDAKNMEIKLCEFRVITSQFPGPSPFYCVQCSFGSKHRSLTQNKPCLELYEVI